MIDWMELLKALAGLALACWLSFVSWRALKTGVIRNRGREYSRKGDPFSFWLLTIMAMVASVIMTGCLVIVYVISR